MAYRPSTFMRVAVALGLALSLTNCATPKPAVIRKGFNGERSAALHLTWSRSPSTKDTLIPAFLWPLPATTPYGSHAVPPAIMLPPPSFEPLTRDHPSPAGSGVMFSIKKNNHSNTTDTSEPRLIPDLK